MELNPTQLPLGRRKSHRVSLRIGATVNAGGRPVRGRLINLSRDGALFELRQRRLLLPGPCTLQLAIGKAPDRYVFIPVEIVRTVPGQFALEWRQPADGREIADLSTLLNA